jgi:hypothetical protein
MTTLMLRLGLGFDLRPDHATPGQHAAAPAEPCLGAGVPLADKALLGRAKPSHTTAIPAIIARKTVLHNSHDVAGKGDGAGRTGGNDELD